MSIVSITIVSKAIVSMAIIVSIAIVNTHYLRIVSKAICIKYRHSKYSLSIAIVSKAIVSMALVSIAIVNTHYMRIVSKALYVKAAAKAAALGLLQPLEALSLDADTLRTATAAAVAYCDTQGAASIADLVERASKLIAHP